MANVDVRRAAALARVSLSDDETARFEKDLERIVGYVEQLMEVDVEGVAPMVQPFDVAADSAARRNDVAGPVLARAALSGSAGFDDETGLVRVPKVIE